MNSSHLERNEDVSTLGAKSTWGVEMSIPLKLKDSHRAQSAVTSIRINNIGSKILVGDINGNISLLEYSSDNPATGFTLNSTLNSVDGAGGCRRVEFFDENYLSGHSKGNIYSYQSKGDSLILNQQFKLENALSVILPFDDKKCFLTGDEEGCVTLIDTRLSSPIVNSVKNHSGPITDMKQLISKTMVSCVGDDGLLSTLDLRKKGSVQHFKISLQEDCSFNCIEYLKNNTSVVVGADNGLIYSFASNHAFSKQEENVDFDKDEFNFSDKFIGHPSSVDQMVKIDEDTLLTASFDGFLRLISIRPDNFIAAFDTTNEHDNMPIEIMQKSENNLIFTTSHDEIVRVFDLQTYLEEEDKEEESSSSDSDEDFKKPKLKKLKTDDFFDDM